MTIQSKVSICSQMTKRHLTKYGVQTHLEMTINPREREREREIGEMVLAVRILCSLKTQAQYITIVQQCTDPYTHIRTSVYTACHSVR